MERAPPTPEPEIARSVRLAWTLGRGESALEDALTPDVLADDDALAEALTADAEERWDRGMRATLETYLPLVPELKSRPEACRSLLLCELARRDDRDDPLVAERMRARLPDLGDEIEAVVGFLGSFGLGGGGANGFGAGDTLDKYELRERIGRGSFGEVWRAWDTELERFVALKLIPQPADGNGDAVLDEARAAASLEHDNIVGVHAAGRCDETGILYIDTQLVAGPSPDDPAEVLIGRPLEEIALGAGGAALAPRHAAGLMATVCGAVAAAHARGVTHGDIKPGNILLTPSGRPMVADFGLAVLAPRPVESGGASRTLSIETDEGRVTGTPAYMSPEQARGARPTPLSDVYSLGVTLLALLTGEHPFSPSRDAQNAARDVIAQVRTGPPDTSRIDSVHPTLGAICARATRPDPRDRYVSAEAMGADLRAWLDRRPTVARPLGAAGRAALWARRNAIPVSTAAAVAALLVVLGVRHVLVVEAQRDRAIAAEAAAEDALAVSDAVNAYMRSVIGAADPRSLGEEATVGEALDAALERVTSDLGDRPRVEAGVRAMIGATYTSLGRHEEGAEQLDLALAMHEELYGDLDERTLVVLHDLATLRQDSGDLAAGEALLLRVIEGRSEVLGPDHALTLRSRADLGRLYRNLERFDESEELLIDTVGRLVAVHGAEHEHTLIARKDLATLYIMTGRHLEAEAPLREVLEAQERTIGADHPDTLVTMSDLATVLRRGDAEAAAEAIKLYERALEGFRARQPVGHLDRCIVLFNIANSLRLAERWDEALPYAEEAVTESEIGLGGDHYVTLMSHALRGGVLGRLGRADEGREELLETRAKFVEMFGEDHGYVTFVDGQLEAIGGPVEPHGGG